ncbi:MAG TPA: hypothetical protein VNM67_13520 [Thermoanaerobaculia bacterium]|nr:hypothetical protein [Thermoanaerobaculia bacterium]
MGDTLSLSFSNATSSTFTLQSLYGCNPNGAPSSIPANGSAGTVISGHNVSGFVIYQDGSGNTFAINFDMPAVYVPGTDNSFSFSCPSNAYVAVISGTPMSGSTANITVLIETPAQAVVTLAEDYSNTYEFVQSMFATNARGVNTVYANAAGSQTAPYLSPTSPPPFTGGFADWTSIQRIVSLWTSFWMGGQPAAGQSFLSTDAQMLQNLAAYVKTNLPVLWVPALEFRGWSGTANQSPPVYYVSGYQSYSLLDSNGNWSENNVAILLLYFLYGAHFVEILDPTSAGSQTITPDLYNTLGTSSTSVYYNLGQQIWDSHYSSVGGQNSGMSYPAQVITQDSVPNPSPLLCAFLIGPTVQPIMFANPLGDSTQRCDFIQLEGWRQFGQATAGWHNADYQAYNETFWNFSTYGVCAFSEKRGTALFLAPAGWQPVRQCSTIMPAYLGALNKGDVSPWMQWPLVAIPLDEQQTVATATGYSSGSGPHFSLSWDADCSITVTMPAGITAQIWHVNGGAGKDENLGTIDSATVLPPGALQYGNYNYYLAGATGATGNFTVTFSACS